MRIILTSSQWGILLVELTIKCKNVKPTSYEGKDFVLSVVNNLLWYFVIASLSSIFALSLLARDLPLYGCFSIEACLSRLLPYIYIPFDGIPFSCYPLMFTGWIWHFPILLVENLKMISHSTLPQRFLALFVVLCNRRGVMGSNPRDTKCGCIQY